MLRSMPRFFCLTLFFLLLLHPSAVPAAGSLEGLTPPERADFSALNWTEAFKLAHEKLSREYAFTEWKGIDWDYLYERFAPEVQFTWAACDERSFYLLLRQYVFSIPDGHMALVSENTAIPAEVARDSAGGGFGLTVVELDNTRAIAATVSPGGQAALAGIEPGAEIITWNCLPIAMAISGVPVDLIPYRPMRPGAFANSESPQATTENHRLEQVKLLVRGPVGCKATVVFRNPGSDNLGGHPTADDEGHPRHGRFRRAAGLLGQDGLLDGPRGGYIGLGRVDRTDRVPTRPASWSDSGERSGPIASGAEGLSLTSGLTTALMNSPPISAAFSPMRF